MNIYEYEQKVCIPVEGVDGSFVREIDGILEKSGLPESFMIINSVLTWRHPSSS